LIRDFCSAHIFSWTLLWLLLLYLVLLVTAALLFLQRSNVMFVQRFDVVTRSAAGEEAAMLEEATIRAGDGLDGHDGSQPSDGSVSVASLPFFDSTTEKVLFALNILTYLANLFITPRLSAIAVITASLTAAGGGYRKQGTETATHKTGHGICSVLPPVVAVSLAVLRGLLVALAARSGPSRGG
jgi:hypothetical protein